MRLYGISLDGTDFKKFFLRYNEMSLSPKTVRRKIKRYLMSRFYTRYVYRYEKKEGARVIAFYSDMYFRNDHFSTFVNFVKEFDYIDAVTPERLPKDRLDIRRGLRMIFWDLFTRKIVRDHVGRKENITDAWIDFGLTLRYASIMLKKTGDAGYKLALVYSDSCPYENLLVQLFKNRGVHTATLEHGKFDMEGPCKGIELISSVADDFLAWNELMLDLASKAGLSNVRVLGIPRYIRRQETNRKKTDTFCVILGCVQSHEENKLLLEYADRLAEYMNKRYYVRLHPSNRDPSYLEGHNQFYFDGGANETISQLCENTDFCITGSCTSMVMDLIYFRQPFYEYNLCKQPFRNNTFSSFEELKDLAKGYDVPFSDETFRYYCHTYDVKESYDAYFRSITDGIH